MSETLNPFKMAQAQLSTAAELMNLDEDIHAILREPMREFHVSIPVRMDNGTLKVSKGFRNIMTQEARLRAVSASIRVKQSIRFALCLPG